MSKTTNLQKVECLKNWLDQFKRSRKYQAPKTSLEDLVDIRAQYAYKESKDE